MIHRMFAVLPYTAVFLFYTPNILRCRLEKQFSKRSKAKRSDHGSGTVLYVNQTRSDYGSGTVLYVNETRSDYSSGTVLYVNETWSRCVIRTGMTKSNFLALRYGRGMAGKRKGIVL
jgi:hypothetical protein